MNNPLIISLIKLWALKPIINPKIPTLASRVIVDTPNADKTNKTIKIAAKYLIKLSNSFTIVLPLWLNENNLFKTNRNNFETAKVIIIITSDLIITGDWLSKN